MQAIIKKEKKKRDLSKRTVAFASRLLPEEIEAIREAGFGSFVAGLRRLIKFFKENCYDKH